MTRPLHRLIESNRPFDWAFDCQDTFETLNQFWPSLNWVNNLLLTQIQVIPELEGPCENKRRRACYCPFQ